MACHLKLLGVELECGAKRRIGKEPVCCEVGVPRLRKRIQDRLRSRLFSVERTRLDFVILGCFGHSVSLSSCCGKDRPSVLRAWRQGWIFISYGRAGDGRRQVGVIRNSTDHHYPAWAVLKRVFG